jgi:hypothetical protein
VLISGSCHCKNISFQLNWEPEPTQIPARACTCSFCTKHGGIWTSCPAGSLEVQVRDPSSVSRYSFGTKTAEFHICARCGIVPVATSRIAGKRQCVRQRRSVASATCVDNIRRRERGSTPCSPYAQLDCERCVPRGLRLILRSSESPPANASPAATAELKRQASGPSVARRRSRTAIDAGSR